MASLKVYGNVSYEWEFCFNFAVIVNFQHIQQPEKIYIYTIHMVDIGIYGSFVFEPEVYNGYIDYSVYIYITVKTKLLSNFGYYSCMIILSMRINAVLEKGS